VRLILDQADRRFMPAGRNVFRLLAPALLAVTVLTVVASVPAGANAPRITKPGAPTAVTATAISGGAAVSWTAPVSDGGSPVTGYTATASHGRQTCTTTGATMCTITGLGDGLRYEIRVRASNVKGEGHPSTRAQVTLPRTVSFASPTELFSGTISVPVTLSRSFARTTVQVDFTTSDGPSGGTNDTYFIGDASAFAPSSGTVTFAPGHTTAAILFAGSSNGDCPGDIPASHCFPDMTVTLSSPVNAVLGAVTSTDVGYDGS
jgi:hypothetical protein